MEQNQETVIKGDKIEIKGSLNTPETPKDIAAIGSSVKISSDGIITIGNRITDYDLEQNPTSYSAIQRSITINEQTETGFNNCETDFNSNDWWKFGASTKRVIDKERGPFIYSAAPGSQSVDLKEVIGKPSLVLGQMAATQGNSISVGTGVNFGVNSIAAGEDVAILPFRTGTNETEEGNQTGNRIYRWQCHANAVFGRNTRAMGRYSQAQNLSTISCFAQTVVGTYNKVCESIYGDNPDKAGALFIVGNGSNIGGIVRQNALEVWKDGRVLCDPNAEILYSNQLVTKRYVDEHKFDDINTKDFIVPAYVLANATYYPFSIASRGTKLGDVHIGQFIIKRIYDNESIFSATDETDSNIKAAFSKIIRFANHFAPDGNSYVDITYECYNNGVEKYYNKQGVIGSAGNNCSIIDNGLAEEANWLWSTCRAIYVTFCYVLQK